MSRLRDIGDLIRRIYWHQTSAPVNYTSKDFSDWLYQKTHFFSLYSKWEGLNRDKNFLPMVIRIDPSKDFSLDNLKVTTRKKARAINTDKISRPVIQLDKNRKEITRYPNARVAAELLNIKFYSNIHMVCKGKRKSCGGYQWTYEKMLLR